MKLLITLLASLTLSPLLPADNIDSEIILACNQYKKSAIKHENAGGTQADLIILSEATKKSSHRKVPHVKIRRNSFEGLEDPHYNSDKEKLEKWAKQERVKKVMYTWMHEGFQRTVMIYQMVKEEQK